MSHSLRFTPEKTFTYIEKKNIRGSGGDGGKIFINAQEINGNGKIIADGGDGSFAGRGGEVHMVAKKIDYTGVVSAKGGKDDISTQKTKEYDWGKWQFFLDLTKSIFAAIRRIY